jgi:hypothetical protein
VNVRFEQRSAHRDATQAGLGQADVVEGNDEGLLRFSPLPLCDVAGPARRRRYS